LKVARAWKIVSYFGVDFMQRYFIEKTQLINDEAIITGEAAHHLRNVMRASIGEQVIICTGKQSSYLAEITHLHKMNITVRIVEKRKENVELPIFVTIAQGITKADKFDLVLQKATECGATAFIPVAMQRSVAKIEATKAAKKNQRWQKIVLEAARQSHRQIVPKVANPLAINDLISLTSQYDICLFADEAYATNCQKPLAKIMDKLKRDLRILVLIGPEGGIADSEVELLTNAGFSAIGLGPRILRTETAAIYLMSALSYVLEIEGRLADE